MTDEIAGLENIVAFDEEAAQATRKRWDEVAKPLGSLGRLEGVVTNIAGMTGDAHYSIDKRAVLVLCADNGVVSQGVTMTPGEVTTVLAKGLAANCLTVNRMAASANIDSVVVDMGITNPLDIEGLLDRRIGPGTNDISQGPAMTREQALQGIKTGIELVRDMKDQGYKILCTGEAGIGNTTTSSAIASVFLGRQVEDVTGPGVGHTPEGLARKFEVIKEAIEKNQPNPDDAIDVIAKLGGFDIAGMCGIFLGGAIYRIPIVIDGLISSVSALCAAKICPEAKTTMLASHLSAEPAGAPLLEELGLKPLITAEMRVGEGTGAVAAIPLFDMAYEVFNTTASYGDLGIG